MGEMPVQVMLMGTQGCKEVLSRLGHHAVSWGYSDRVFPTILPPPPPDLYKSAPYLAGKMQFYP